MKGSIDLKSTVGQGTCFTVTLPFIFSEEILQSNQSVKISKEKPAFDFIKIELAQETSESKNVSVRVLLVEDSQIAAMALKLSLKPFNCLVDIASNGQEAVNKATENNYDLILMDVGLPDFSGVEATKKIRSLSDKENANVTIIAVTGHADNPEMAKECLDAGMQEVLAKPANNSKLEAIFQQYVFSKEKVTTQGNNNSSNQYGINKKIFDIAASIKILGDEQSAWHMLDILCQELPHDVEKIKDAEKKGDVTKLRELFHKIRGGLNYFKTPEMEMAIIELHDGVKTRPLSELQELFKKFYLTTEVLFETYRNMKIEK